MPFCSNCGAAVEGRFCAKCGSPVTGGAPPLTDSGYPQTPHAAPLADNVASTLCYVAGLISGVIFLAISPYNQNRTVRFHAFQSIFLHVGVIVCYIGAGIVFSFLRLFAFFNLWPMIGLALFILWIYMLVSTYQGKHVELPIIGQLARQQAG
jgi:uncharacterized membrane protein